MIFMKRMLIIVMLVLLPLAALPNGDAAPRGTITVTGETINVTNGTVTLTMLFESQGGAYNDTVDVWAPADATLTCQGIELTPTWNESIATVDLAAHDLSIPAGGILTLTACYARDGDLVHRMLYDAPITITVNSTAYVRSTVPLSYAGGSYTGTASLEDGDTLTISFTPAAADDGNTLLYLAAGLAVGILIGLAGIALLSRQRRDRHLEKEPVEALQMRKKLLTQLLKQLDIERDKGKIADAYYQSIRESFKEEAVHVMREIDRRS
jgi:hypothetical protein